MTIALRKPSLIRNSIATLAAACVAFVAVAAGPDNAGKMTHAKVGHEAPDFTLADLDGKEHTLSDFAEDGKIVVLEWYNPGCPYVKKHYRDDTMTMNKLADKYRENDVVWIRINSGAPGKQGTGLEFNQKMAEEWKIKDPILLDESGKVGKMYNAKNTPAMAVVHSDGTLAYWGAIDDDRGGRNAGETNYVDLALTALINGESVETAETKPYGCSVKYAAETGDASAKVGETAPAFSLPAT